MPLLSSLLHIIKGNSGLLCPWRSPISRFKGANEFSRTASAKHTVSVEAAESNPSSSPCYYIFRPLSPLRLCVYFSLASPLVVRQAQSYFRGLVLACRVASVL